MATGRLLLVVLVSGPLLVRAWAEVERGQAGTIPAVPASSPPDAPRSTALPALAEVEAALAAVAAGREADTDGPLRDVTRRIAQRHDLAARFARAAGEECDAEGRFPSDPARFDCPELRGALEELREGVRAIVTRRRRLESEHADAELTRLLRDWIARCQKADAARLPPFDRDAIERAGRATAALTGLIRDGAGWPHLLGKAPALRKRWDEAARVMEEDGDGLATLDAVCRLLGSWSDGRTIARSVLRRQTALPEALPLDTRVRLVTAGGTVATRDRKDVHIWWTDGTSERLAPRYDEFRLTEDPELKRRVQDFDPTGNGGQTFKGIEPTERSRAARRYNRAAAALGADWSLDRLRRLRQECEPGKDYLGEVWPRIDLAARTAERYPHLFE